MNVLERVALTELQQHERNCDTAVILGSHGMDLHSPPGEFRLYRAVLEPADIDALYLLDCGFVQYTRGRSGRVRDIVYEIVPEEMGKRIESFINPGPHSEKNSIDLRLAPHLALTLVCDDTVGPWTIIDGNHRAVSQYLQFDDFTGVPVYVCVHPKISSWPYIPQAGRRAGRKKARSIEAAAGGAGRALPSEEEQEPAVERILHLCARIEPHPTQQELLAEVCTSFTAWETLLHRAEVHGMGPLLHRHLTALYIELPNSFIRRLRLIRLRHRQTNILLSKTLGRVLEILAEAGIPVLVLKGAALCQTLYPEPGLRPMRDIDVLLAHEDVFPAHALLQQHGFRDPAVPMPEDHLHLAALYKNVAGLQVCLELHRDLFPDCPPWRKQVEFAELRRNAEPFIVDGITAYTLAPEEMLRHLYEHAFHAPLPYEPYKLISAADIVGFVEERLEKLDWEKMQSIYPHLPAALPFLHHLTPWRNTVQEKLSFRENRELFGVGASFTGWPRRKLKEQRGRGVLPILRDTFWPSAWWLRLYYAPTGIFSLVWCRLIEHPRHIFWWIRLYWNVFLRVNLPREEGSEKSWTWGAVLQNGRTLARALWRKMR